MRLGKGIYKYLKVKQTEPSTISRSVYLKKSKDDNWFAKIKDNYDNQYEIKERIVRGTYPRKRDLIRHLRIKGYL